MSDNIGRAFEMLLDMGASEADRKWKRLFEELFYYVPQTDSWKPRYSEVASETIKMILK